MNVLQQVQGCFSRAIIHESNYTHTINSTQHGTKHVKDRHISIAISVRHHVPIRTPGQPPPLRVWVTLYLTLSKGSLEIIMVGPKMQGIQHKYN